MLQAVAAGRYTAEDSAYREADDAHRALNETIFGGRETQSAVVAGVDEEQRRDLGQQAFGHAVEQHEADSGPHLGLAEEGDNRILQLAGQLTGRHRHPPAVLVGTRQHPVVIQPQGYEEARHEVEHEAPRIADVACDDLQIAGQHDEEALSEDCRYAVESRTDADEESLAVLVKAEHVESVGRYVVGGARKGHQPEETQCSLKPERAGNGEGHAAQRRTDEQLHGQNPPALGQHDVDERTPEGLYDPRKIEPGGVECDVGVGHTQPLIHYQRYRHDGHVGYAFGEIECGHPCPRIADVSHFQYTFVITAPR